MALTFCVTSPPRIYSQRKWLAKCIYPRLLLARCLTMIILDFACTPEKVVVEQNIFSNFEIWQNFCSGQDRAFRIVFLCFMSSKFGSVELRVI